MGNTPIENKTLQNKVLIIGIDGATFDVIKPMIAEGKLPNLSHLMRGGSHGILQSSIPPLSPTAWSSFMTGTNPAKHGILDFFGRCPDSYLTNFYNASNRQEKPLWILAGEHNRKVVVVNVPATYPPDRVNGFMISGMDTPGKSTKYMYPPELMEELEKEVGGYTLEIINLRDSSINSDVWLKGLYDILENRFVVAKYLMQKYDWDLFVLVFDSTDRVQHKFWGDEVSLKLPGLKKVKGNQELVKKVYEKVDQKIGALLKGLEEDVNVVVLSDHGFGPVNRAVRLNLWLAQQGYMSFSRKSKLMGYGITRAKVKIMEMILHYGRGVANRVSNMIKKENSVRSDNRVNVLSRINWTNTRAYCMGGMGNIFVNLKGREPSGTVQPGSEYESVVNELIEKLREFTDPLTGEKVFSQVFKRSEVYCGKLMEKAPDILLEWAYGYSFIGERERFLFKIDDYHDNDIFISHQWAGNHLPNGIIILHGKDVKEGVELRDATIMDVAPTVLYLMGLPLSSNMDGHPLKNAIKDEFLNDHSMKYQELTASQASSDDSSKGYSEDEAEQVKKHLRDLGYIE